MTTESDDDRAARMNRNSDAMEELVAANHESNATMLALVEHVRKETAARDRKIEVLEKTHRQTRYLVIAVCGAVLVMLGLGIVNAINLAATKDQQDQTRRINAFLLDCVNSTGECGRANAVKQAEILQSVKQYELTGFYCIRTNPGTEDPKGENFLKCMERLYPGGPTLNGRWP